MIDRTTGESFGPESIKVRRFGLLSYEEVEHIFDLVDHIIGEMAECEECYMLFVELTSELELRG